MSARAYLSIATALLTLTACQGGKGETRAPSLHLVSVSPATVASDDLEPLRLGFDQPVVDAAQVGTPLDNVPLSIEPPLQVSAHWVDRQTLVAKPLSAMAPATRYTVRPTGELAVRLPEDTEHSFVNRPLRVERLLGLDREWAPPSARFSLQLNHPIDAGQLVDKCKLTRSDDDTRLPLSTPDAAFVATSLPLAPASPLTQGQSYAVVCEGLIARGGNAPLAEPFRASFRVYPKAAVLAFTPANQQVTPDELKLTLTMATPIEYEELAKKVVLRPGVEGFGNSWVSRGPGVYESVVNLKAQTQYKLVVKKGLTDRFGQQLDKAVVQHFETTDAAPSVQLETGIYAIEANGSGYPVWTRNVSDLALHCAHVPKDKLVGVLTSSMNYDPWYDAGDDQVSWEELGLSVQKHALTLDDVKNKWSLQRFDLPALCGGRKGVHGSGGEPGERGVYLAEVRSESVRAAKSDRGWGSYPYRLLGNVTDLGVLLKAGPASGLVWVTSLSGGAPVVGASVTLYDPNGERVYSGRTDRDGILRTPGTSKLLEKMHVRDSDEGDEEEGWGMYRAQRMIVVVEHAGDLAVVDGNWQNGIQVWNFGLPQDSAAGVTRIRGFIQSDRGIYRPGERVHFKGIVREVAIGKAPVVPTGERVQIKVEDARGASVLEQGESLSRFGGFAFDLELDAEAPLGDYYVTATVKGQTFRETFHVEEFRPVAFEITRKDALAHTRVGEGMELRFGADYLFGAPVKDAAVTWDVQRRDHRLDFKELPGYTFTDSAKNEDWYYWYDGEDASLSFVSDGQTQTDAGGAFTVSFRDPEETFDGPQDYLVQARVTDSTHQTVSKRVVVTAHETEFYLGLHSQEWVQAVDMPFAINAVAIAPDGKRRPASAKLSLSRRTWECKRSGEHRIYTTCERSDQAVWTRPVSIPATGTATERIVPDQPGEYTIALHAEDGAGKPVIASMTVWVIGKGEAFWSGDESARMSIIADREQYQPGDTARLVPRANVGGAKLLVTLERNGILDAFVLSPQSSGEGLSLPIADVHAPNVFASVAMVRGRSGPGDEHRPEFKLGMVDLRVSTEHKRLAVDITTEREEYEPGQTVRGKLKLHAGAAPVQGELSLSVADEGVLQLIAYKTPDPMEKFYAPWGLGIDSATNLNRVARLNDPSEVDNEAGADGSSEGGDRVRSRFVSSALWIPALVTDANGEAEFSFEAPDNLTAFRLMAVAADTGDRFGNGERRIRIAKKLLAKPVLPRFAASGDSLEIGAVIHNYSGQDGEAVVSLQAKGLTVSKGQKRVTVKAGDSAPVLFSVRAGKAKRATVKLAVELGGYRDAFELPLPLNRPLVTEWDTLAAGETNAGDQAIEAQVSWPEDKLGWLSLVEVNVDRTGLSDLGPSLRYLVTYPYGCLEQTMSSLLPLVKAKDLADSLDLVELRGTAAERYIRLGVAKVLRHQHADGHFSLWPGSQTYPHLTAYALWGLTEMERAGVSVKGDVFERGLEALRRWATAGERSLSPGGEIGSMAMAAYVLAERGQNDPGLNARLLEARGALPLVGKAYLLRALLRAGQSASDIELMTADLLVAVDAPPMSWPGERDYYMSSQTRDRAIALSALLEAGGHDQLATRLVRDIKDARTDSRWLNTQENVYGLIALADYARSRAGGSTEVKLTLDGAPLETRKVKGSEVMRFWRTASKLPGGALRLTASAPVHYSVRRKLVRELGEQPAVAEGFELDRQYLDFKTEKPVSEVKLGQLIKVKLTVRSGKKAHYVALVDPIPAGCEAVNTELATESNYAGTQRDYRWDHVELRDDRVLAFADQLMTGDGFFEYLLRPTIAGRFAAPPTHVEAMYEPTRMARTGAAELTVKR